jgi:hypothetical protein
MIPLNIYRTWSSTTLPVSFQNAWNDTALHNQNARQILFTDRSMNVFMRKYYAEKTPWRHAVFGAYQSINPLYGAARADFFRYALIYQLGGIYLDIKSSAYDISKIIRPDDEMILSHWPLTSIVRLWSQLHLLKFSGEYQQWWLAARAGHPMLESVLNYTMHNIHTYSTRRYDAKRCASVRNLIGTSLVLYLVPSCRGTDVLWTTGPFAFSRAIDDFSRRGSTAKVRILKPDGDHTFEYDKSGDHRHFAHPYFAVGYPLILK